MNYSYLMGINDIEKLKQNNFEIKSFGNNYGVIFDENKIELLNPNTHYFSIKRI